MRLTVKTYNPHGEDLTHAVAKVGLTWESWNESRTLPVFELTTRCGKVEEARELDLASEDALVDCPEC